MEALDLLDLLRNPTAAAVTLRQSLEPEIVAPDGSFTVYPPTHDAGGYTITDLGNGHNQCALDTIPSQANRIEAALQALPERDRLLPRVRITVPDVAMPGLKDKDKANLLAATGLADLANAHTGERVLDMLELPHRLADAAIRFSNLNRDALSAFLAFDKGNPAPIAGLSPMSLLCGAWDSQLSQVKIPRALTAVLTAYNVTKISKRSWYLARVTGDDLREIKEAADVKTLSDFGLDNAAPKGEVFAGVRVTGGVARDVVLNLIALRANAGKGNPLLVDYLLALGLLGLALPLPPMLRQGCTLLPARVGGVAQVTLRNADGRSETIELPPLQSLIELVAQTATAFFGGPPPSKEGRFDRGMVKALLAKKPAKEGKTEAAGKARGSKVASSAAADGGAA